MTRYAKTAPTIMPTISRAVISEIAEGKADNAEVALSVSGAFFHDLCISLRLPESAVFGKFYQRRRRDVLDDFSTLRHRPVGDLIWSPLLSPWIDRDDTQRLLFAAGDSEHLAS